MDRALLTISYDGTDYCGWQRQSGQTTVQQVIEDALETLYGRQTVILGASRTDSGVHAICQKATFTPETENIPFDKIAVALNPLLPRDVRVVRSERVGARFHVINDVVRKTYVYKIQNAPVYDPVLFRYTHNVKEKSLDVDKMKLAARHFVGEHDFKAFCAAHSGAATTTRTVFSVDISQEHDIISLEICGNGFLYNMIRIIAGTLVEVGAGKRSPDEIPAVISSKKRESAGKTLPAKGLTLVSVQYGETEE